MSSQYSFPAMSHASSRVPLASLALDHMKIAVHDRYDKEIWPQLHFTHDKPSSSSTVDTETPKSA